MFLTKRNLVSYSVQIVIALSMFSVAFLLLTNGKKYAATSINQDQLPGSYGDQSTKLTLQSTVKPTKSNPSTLHHINFQVSLEEMMKGPYNIQQDDPLLVENIRNNFLIPPSTSAYHLSGDTEDPSMGQSQKIRELLGEKRKGFFIECGALDGETRSNTLVFEKSFAWNGILIEGDPKNVKLIKGKSRKAHVVPACLSNAPYPKKVMFKQSFNVGRITDIKNKASNKKKLTEVQCLPLYSVLLALNVTSVDYFSLDVEGDELPVLKSIPWDKVNITTLSVEYIHGKDGKEAMKKYMEGIGYKVYGEVTNPQGLANDFIFYHPKLIGNF